MPDMLEPWVMLHTRLHTHHRVLFWLRCASLIALAARLIVIVIVATIFVGEVLRALVLVRAAIVLEAAHYLVDVG